MGYIYLVTNLINDKKYVGKTTDTIENRWKAHKYAAFIRKLDFYFYKALRKYGIENFSIKQVEECPNEKLNERERYYIDFYKTFYIYRLGYNLTRGGDGNTQVDDNEIMKIWHQGYSSTELAKQFNFYVRTITNVLKRNGVTQEEIYHRAAVYGASHAFKKVYQYDYEGNLVDIYESLNDMHEKTGYNKDYIGATCNHKYATANGYIWLYENDETPIEELVKKIPPELNHPVLQYSMDGILLREYSSFGEAEKDNGLSKGFIGKVVNELTTTAGGYIWIEKNSNITIEDKLQAISNRYKDREKPVFQYSAEGVFIKQYESIIKASRETGIDRSNIQKSSQKGEYLAGGFIWLRENDEELVKQIVKKNNKLTIPVEQYDKKGNYIATYPSVRAAAKALGQEEKYHNIYKAIQGRQKTSLGYIWKYKIGS